jgi:type I restriction enzyme R subunit
MSNFAFLAPDFPAFHDAAASAEELASGGKAAKPNLAIISAGRAVEIAVKWAFAHDDDLSLPYQDNIATLLHDRGFREVLGPDQTGRALFQKLKYVNKMRNVAAHEEKALPLPQAQDVVRELFHIAYWFARTYGRTAKPDDGISFDDSVFTRSGDVMRQAAEVIRKQKAAIEERDRELEALRARANDPDVEKERLRKEVARLRAAAMAAPDHHEYNEEQTRDRFIDLLLREADWTSLKKGHDVEYRVTPMPNEKNEGFADYVLWGDDGLPLAVIEAKRTKHDARKGQQQAKLYADALEAMHGRRPVIFYTNGYEHWIWDDAGGRPPRQLGGFYKKDELELMVRRRDTAKPLATVTPDPDIAGRPYQLRAIGRIAEAFDKGANKALLVMATGTGKTRTVIALVDAMQRAGLVKRTLFLADRVSLAKQAAGAFKAHLPSSSPVNLVTEKDGTGRVYVSTYPTMMGLIDGKREKGEGERHFGPGHFDLIIIDEAHRSVYKRYKAIFEYFDSYLVGLTATPRDEVDRDTYELFDLEPGVPTDAYDLNTAIGEDYLVPYEPLSFPSKFISRGIKYDDLSHEEKEQWDMLDWEDGEVPDEVSPEAINKFFFNIDTVDKILGIVMTEGIKVAGGDRLGKTILFAKNQKHAEFIEERFNANWPHLAGHFARVITYKGDYAQSLIDQFSLKDENPHLAISVDMMDTGIDVPEVVNLVFFKLVRSKTKFWQMVGRGTRLCPDLFGPDQDKEAFRIFDFCQNLEYFSQDPATRDAKASLTLTERLFQARLSLVRQLGSRKDEGGFSEDPERFKGHPDAPSSEEEIAASTLGELKRIIASMDFENFVVRTKRALVEKYQKGESWETLDDAAAEELGEIAGLPNGLPTDNEEAKRFDLLIYNLELAVLKGSKRYEKLKKQVVEIAAALELKASVPAIKQHLELIEDLQREDWWEGINVPLLELVRVRLREVVKLIDRTPKKILYSNFEDEVGEGESVTLPNISAIDEVSFRKKVRAFLKKHEDDIALRKVQAGKPLTKTDLEALQSMLIDAGVATHDDIDRASEASKGFGIFVRSLVGLDQSAVEAAFADFLDERATANQIEFIKLIIAHLTKKGVMDASMIYESPFSDLAPSGPEDLFGDEKVVRILETVRRLSEPTEQGAA